MKRWLGLCLLGTALLMNGCSDASTQQEGTKKSVGVQPLTVETKAVQQTYTGVVDAKELVKYSFKVDGKIDRIYVKKGDAVQPGTVLATLDTTDLGFQVEAARAAAESAKHGYEKANAAKSLSETSLNRVNSLYQSGAASQNEYDQARTSRDVSSSDAGFAKSQWDAAKTDYQYKSDLLKNAVLRAEKAGVVAEKTYNEEERAGAFTPVIVVRSGEQVVKIGVPQQELKNIHLGASAAVEVDGVNATGVITSISELPDPSTHTYTAEITVKDQTFQIGSIAKVKISGGDQSGIWIPLSAMLSDGEPYVYVVEKNRAIKRIIQVESGRDDRALVTGLKAGDVLVTSGMNNLEDGIQVSVQK